MAQIIWQVPFKHLETLFQGWRRTRILSITRWIYMLVMKAIPSTTITVRTSRGDYTQVLEGKCSKMKFSLFGNWA